MGIRTITLVFAGVFSVGVVTGFTVALFILGLNLINPDPFASNPHGSTFLGIAFISLVGLFLTLVIDGVIDYIQKQKKSNEQ